MKAKLSLLTERRTQISILLTIIALLLWSHSILYAKFEIGYFGLIHGLPVTFFVALASLTAASTILWVSKERHGKLLCLQLLILISALWLIPVITGGSPPFTNHAYRSLGLIEYIARRGHFAASEVFYLSWPGAYILSTTLAEVLSVNFESMLGLFPLFMQLLYLPPLYVFLKNTLGQTQGNYCWAGAWLFYVANWTGTSYFSSAPGFGLLLLLVLLALVTTPSTWERSTKGSVLLFLVVCVFTTLVITHLLIALAALCIMAALSLLKLLKRSKKAARVTGLCFLILVSWNLTGAAGHTKSGMAGLNVIAPGETIEVFGETIEVFGEPIEVPGKTQLDPRGGGRSIILSPAIIVYNQITMHLSGSKSHIAVAKTRLLFSVLFAIIGIVGAVVAFLTKCNRNTAIFILAMALAPLILLVIPYAGRMLDRLYFLLLAPMAYFGARLLDVRKRVVVPILCLFLVVSLPLHLIACYGNQTYDYFPQGQVCGSHFFYDETTNGHIIALDNPWVMRNIESYRFIPVTQLQWQDNMILPKGGFRDSPYWVYITRQDRAYCDFIHGDSLFIGKIENALSNTTNCNLVYYNPDYKLYSLEPSVLP